MYEDQEYYSHKYKLLFWIITMMWLIKKIRAWLAGMVEHQVIVT